MDIGRGMPGDLVENGQRREGGSGKGERLAECPESDPCVGVGWGTSHFGAEQIGTPSIIDYNYGTMVIYGRKRFLSGGIGNSVAAIYQGHATAAKPVHDRLLCNRADLAGHSNAAGSRQGVRCAIESFCVLANQHGQDGSDEPQRLSCCALPTSAGLSQRYGS